MLAGHDRGGRVTYRLALDHPGRLSKVATLDIQPTYDYWAKMDRAFGLRAYHWLMLAQPHPVPENLIQSNPDDYFGRTFQPGRRRMRRTHSIHARSRITFTALRDPLRIHAACEDYRAGAYADLDHDKADLDAGKKITAPLLALWGGAGFRAAAAGSPLMKRLAQSGDQCLRGGDRCRTRPARGKSGCDSRGVAEVLFGVDDGFA